MSKKSSYGDFEFLRQLTETPGIPGREERVRDLILRETEDLWDEVEVDNLGNLICLKRAAGSSASKGRKRAKKSTAGSRGKPAPKVMLACHMDEIGFYVRHIDENGFLRINNAGGFDVRNLFARKVLVQGKRDLLGALNPGGKPIHISSQEERKKIPEMREFYVDLFLPREEVEKQVAIGDPVTLWQKTEMIGDAVMGKCMDNRIAVWVGINAIRKAAKNLKYDAYFVACAQEEVGCRGAATAAYRIEPDYGVAIDVTLACDTPGVSKDDSVTEFGKGVALKVMDAASISHRGLFEEFVALANRKRIPHQREVLPMGGTDASAVQRARTGAKAITLSIPCRYIHTITETINKRDAQNAVDLLAAWLAK